MAVTLIPISFTQQEWNYIYNAVSKSPYCEVVDILVSMKQQFDTNSNLNPIPNPDTVEEV